MIDNANLSFNRSDSVIFAKVISGSGTLTQAGSGSTILTGANSFSGDAIVSNGTLQIGNGGSSGSIASNVVNNASLVFKRSDDVTFGQSISGSGTLTQAGSGALILTGSNSFSGNAVVNSGSLQIGNGGSSGNLSANIVDNSAVVFKRSDSVTYVGNISGSGTLTQAGSGTTILTGNNSHSGLTTISSGTLQLGNGGSSGAVAGAIANNANLSVNRSDAYSLSGVLSGSGTLNQNGSGSTTLSQVGTQGNINVNAGQLIFGQSGSFSAANVAVASGATATIGSAARLAASGTLSVNGNLGVSVSTGPALITAASATLGANSVLNVAGFAADASDKASALEADRTQVIQTTNGISGNFASVNLGGAAAGGDYLVVDGEKSADGKSYSVGTALAWTAGGSTANGTFTLIDASNTFDVDVVLANQAANPLTQWDGQSLTKAGAGTLTLSAANSYSGSTTVNGGTLRSTLANNLNSSSAVSVASGATLALVDVNQTLNQLSGAGQVTIGSATLTARNVQDSELDGGISGSGA